MSPRKCPKGHTVDSHTALYCPLCGAPMPEAGSAIPETKAEPVQKKRSSSGRIAIVITCLIVGYICVQTALHLGDDTSSSQASGATRTPRPTSTRRPSPTPTPTNEEIKALAVTCSYEELARYTEEHVGEIVYYKAEVQQVEEHTFIPTTVRVYVEQNEYGWWDGNVWVNYDCDGPRLLDDDIIDLYARVVGRRKYTAVLGNSIEVPELDALIVELEE